MVTVLGLGNVLMGDDALGPYVVRTIDAGYELDPRVSLLDAGTPGLDLIPYILGSEALIVVDTVRADGEPGEVRLYRRAQLLRSPPSQRLNTHDPGLKETLLTLELHGAAPADVLLVGVIPQSVATGVGLTHAVKSAANQAIGEVLRELKQLGCRVRHRRQPARADIWWEPAA